MAWVHTMAFESIFFVVMFVYFVVVNIFINILDYDFVSGGVVMIVFIIS